MSKNTRTRILLTAVAALLLVTMAVGGTLAWLQDDTETVTNTFNPNNISVDIAESDTDGDGDTLKNAYEIVPGVNITKDPTVTYTSTVDAYIFIKETKSGVWPAGMTYELESIWQDVPGYDGVYYTTVKGSDAAATLNIIKNTQITVANTITNENMPKEALTLSYEAWAIQMANGNDSTFSPADAYKQAAGL